MAQALQWTYDKRDPISWGAAALVLGGVLLSGPLLHNDKVETQVTEMTAVLESTPEPVPPPPPAVLPPAVLASPRPEPQLNRVETPPTVRPQVVSQLPTLPAEIVSAPEPSAQVFAPKLPAVGPTPAATQLTQTAVTEVPPAKPVPVPSLAPAPAILQSKYEAQLLAYLEKIKRYPTSREARQTRAQGVVKVWLELSRDGMLMNAGIESSSGSNLLDNEALRTLRGGNFPSFSTEVFPGEASHRFSARLDYQIAAE
jgi:protein TonB